MKKTFLILLGTQKSGSTWLSHQLRSSDAFFGAGLKEWRLWTPYFTLNPSIQFQIDGDFGAPTDHFLGQHTKDNRRNSKIARANVRAELQQDPKGFLNNCVAHLKAQDRLKVLGDLTPSTGMLEVDQLKNIAELFAREDIETKSILLVRDPLQRALSQARMRIEMRHPEISQDEKAINAWIVENQHSLTQRSRLDDILGKIKPIESHISTKVVFFDDLFRQDSFDGICRHLNISPFPVSLDSPNETMRLPIHHETKMILAKSLQATYDYMDAYFDGKPREIWPGSYKYLAACTPL